MARKFTTPFGPVPSSIAQQQQFTDALRVNKVRTHEYRRWSDRATVLSYDSSTDSYSITLSIGSNDMDTAQTFEGVRAIVPADVRQLTPGTVVAIGYLQERREQPIIMGVGSVRQKITKDITTPLSTNLKFPGGGGLILRSDHYDDNLQPGDPHTNELLHLDPASLGSGGCTSHVHAVGGVGLITWTWSYGGADRIFEVSGTNDFRLTFGVKGGGSGSTSLAYTLRCCRIKIYIPGPSPYQYFIGVSFNTIPATDYIVSSVCYSQVGTQDAYNIGSICSYESFWAGPGGPAIAALRDAGIGCDDTPGDITNCLNWGAGIGTADLSYVDYAAYVATGNADIAAFCMSNGVTKTGTISSCALAPCISSNNSTLTATDEDGNMATAIISAS